MFKKILVALAISVGTVSVVAAPQASAVGKYCSTQTVVYFKDKITCIMGPGDYIVRTLPKSYGLYDALIFAGQCGGGRVVAWGNGLAVVVYK